MILMTVFKKGDTTLTFILPHEDEQYYDDLINDNCISVNAMHYSFAGCKVSDMVTNDPLNIFEKFVSETGEWIPTKMGELRSTMTIWRAIDMGTKHMEG